MVYFTYFAIYFVIWWLCLFIVLPYGNRSQAEEGDIIQGTDPGAPIKPQLGKKLIINSLFALLVLGLYVLVRDVFGFSLDRVPNIFPDHLSSG